jgi:hypothetical protein
MKKIKLILILLLFLNLFNIIASWRCGADQLKIKPGVIKTGTEEKKRKLISNYRPIKIIADYSNFKTNELINEETLKKIRNLIEETCEEFSKFVKVEHVNIQLAGNENTIMEQCEINSLGQGYENYLINNDLIIFPSFDSTLGVGVLAAASLCLYTTVLKPVAGILYINPGLSFDKSNMELYMKTLLFHELTHVLIFNPQLMKELGMTTTKIFDGSFVTFINSPRVLTAARQHFNCPTLNGIPLENQGGEGSAGAHWEARYMLGDYMLSTDYFENVLSDITLALFEDSGFYKVNYYSGGLFKYGKNTGCSFFEKKCIENGDTDFKNDFCTNYNEDFCSRSKTIKGKCLIHEYKESIPSRYRYFDNKKYGGFYSANYCPVSNSEESKNYYFPNSCKVGVSTLNEEYGETFSNSSFCFMSSLLPTDSTQNSLNQAICYKVDCDKTNKQLIVFIGNTTKIICPKEGGKITPSGFKGSIDCPTYTDICGFDSEDNDICNEMFTCLDKKVETDAETFSYFPDEDEVFEKVIINNNDYTLRINLIFILLFLLF